MKMKRILSLIFALIFILSLVSCGTYTPPATTDTEGTNDTNTDTGTGEKEDVTYSDSAFTVSLRYRGNTYIPSEDIYAIWTGEGKIASSEFNKEGIAGVEGLDGDYRVTLSSVPEGVAYNPNAYTSTNDERNLVIDLYDIQKTTGKGTDLYKAISVTKAAVYQVKLNSQTHIVYYEFRPTVAGMYTVESWMDTTAERFNPYCESYNGTFAAKFFDETIDGGGKEGIYTKNFKDTIDVSEDMLGNVLTFGIHVDAKNQDNFPVTVTFAIQLNGGFDGYDYGEYDMYVMQEDEKTYLSGMKEYGEDYEFVEAVVEIPGRENAYLYDERNYRLWEKEMGGDDLYHVYDEELYPETGGYGPILYAYISSPCKYIDRAFTFIEQESKPLSVTYPDGTKINYKHFIEGYTALATSNEPLYNGGSYYCDEYCPCHPGGGAGMACTAECEKCIPDCGRIKPENIGFEGIRQYANSDGVVAVTKEIKDFLYYFSINQRYFADGEGWVELVGLTEVVDGVEVSYTVDSNDASQWLFACGYYKKIN